MTREIPLTQGRAALVSDEDFDRVCQYRWCAVLNGKHWYAKHASRTSGKYVNVYLHKFILGLPASQLVDHVNGDGLDCRRENLRPATPADNCRNSRMPSTNTTGFKGVCFFKGRYVAKAGGRYLGRYRSAEEAARVYDAKARELFGDFALLNFPQEGERQA